MVVPQRKSTLHAILERHWNGDVPLYQAFWVAIVAYGVIWHALWFGIYLLLSRFSFHPLASAIAAATYWCFYVAFYSWQCIGTWRAADKFDHTSKTPAIAIGSKACVTLIAMLMTAESIYLGGDVVFEKGQIAAQYFAAPAMTFQVTEDGQQLNIEGQISYDTAGKLTRILETTPTIKTVSLNSSGGDFDQAIAMRNIIRKHTLETSVVGACTFSCTHVYLGGLIRHLDSTIGKLGFHAPKSLSAFSKQNIKAEDAAVREAISYRVDEAFAEKAYRNNADSLWFPSRAELLAANVIND